MSLKDLISLIFVFFAGLVFGAAVLLLVLSFVSVAKAEEPVELTLEQQMEIHTQYLTATDEALNDLNHCGAWISLIPFMNEATGMNDPRALQSFRIRTELLGNTVGFIVYNAEYYFPHIYGVDTNFKTIEKLSTEWVDAVSNHPKKYEELAQVWFKKCEFIAFNPKTYFSRWILQYPAIMESWPYFPGREKPPEDWVSPSMKRVQKLMKEELQ